MRSLLLLLLTSFPTIAAGPTNRIKVDQVGYLSFAPKIALVVATNPAADFAVRRKQVDSLAFQGKLSEPVDDPDTSDRVQAADFKCHKGEKRCRPGKQLSEGWLF
jgi:Cellulase N-terminal ig-like domain